MSRCLLLASALFALLSSLSLADQPPKHAAVSTPFPSSRRAPPPWVRAPRPPTEDLARRAMAEEAENPKVRPFVLGTLSGRTVPTEFTGKESDFEKQYGFDHDVASPNGNILVGVRNGKLAILDTRTGQTILNLDWPRRGAAFLAQVLFTPDSRYVALSFGNDMVYLLKLPEGEVLTQFAHGEHIRFSPDGKYLISYTEDLNKEDGRKSMRLVETKSGKTLAIIPTGGLVRDLRFSKDGKYAFARTYDEGTSTIDLAAGKELLHKTGDFYQLSPDQRYFVNDNRYEGLSLEDAVTGRQVKAFPELSGAHSASLSPDGKVMKVNIGQDEKARTLLVDVASGKQLAETRFGEFDSLNHAQFSPNSRRALIFSSSSSDKFRLFDTDSGKLLAEVTPKKDLGIESIQSVTFSPDSRTALVCSYGGKQKLLDTDTGKVVGEFKNLQGTAFSPDGRWLVLNQNGAVKVFDTRSRTMSQTVELEKDHSVIEMKFSADSRHLAFRHYEGGGVRNRLVDLENGFEVPLDDSNTGKPASVSFDERGTIIVTAPKGITRLRSLPRR